MKNLHILVGLAFVLTVQPSFASNKGDAKKGKNVFQTMNCAICHKDGGNSLNPERPLKGATFLQRYPADNKELEKAIRNGFPDKGMQPFGQDKMSDQDLSDVIAFVRTLTTPDTAKNSKKGHTIKKSK